MASHPKTNQPGKRKYTKSGKERKKREGKRHHMDAKKSTETPVDKRGGFYRSENLSDWCGAKCTQSAPFLF